MTKPPPDFCKWMNENMTVDWRDPKVVFTWKDLLKIWLRERKKA